MLVPLLDQNGVITEKLISQGTISIDSLGTLKVTLTLDENVSEPKPNDPK